MMSTQAVKDWLRFRFYTARASIRYALFRWRLRGL
jgi:hypothetical protein